MGIGEVFNISSHSNYRNYSDLKDILLQGLNPEQKKVVLHDTGPLLVGAVAGSGKTHALIYRIAYLVAIRKVNPARILAVTFSKKGADEMQVRLDNLIGKSDARIGTFHSFALEIIRNERPKYVDEKWKVDDRSRYRYCLKDATGYKEMDWEGADINILDSFIALCKCNMARPDSEEALEVAKEVNRKNKRPSTNPQMMLQAYAIAEEIRKERRLLGFDDMLMEATELLRDDEALRKRWASRFDYVLQDEAQDQNLCQLLMGEYLAQYHRNYMLVGDPGQTIFTWRGAKPEKLLSFQDRWNAELITMNRNYRCGSDIINIANLSLENMSPETKLDMQMICERNVQGNIAVAEYGDLDEEGTYIAERIQTMMIDGCEAKDFVILYRTNAQSRAPEEALISARIPYRIIGGASFYERKEVKNLLAYLRLAEGRGDLDDIARAINSPFRFLGKAFLDRIREAAKRTGIHRGKESNTSWSRIAREVCYESGIQRRQKQNAEEWASMIERMKYRIEKARTANELDTESRREGAPSCILEDIIRETRYTEWLQRDEGEETPENSRVSNVREMIRAAGRFNDVGDLLDYVDETLSASKKQRKSDGDTPNKVTLCSIHRSKGLEWPCVFLAGTCENILPHGKCEDPEEERRLFYVAVTRAKDHLFISSVRNVAYGNRNLYTYPSRFIAEVGLEAFPIGDDFDEDEDFEEEGEY